MRYINRRLPCCSLRTHSRGYSQRSCFWSRNLGHQVMDNHFSFPAPDFIFDLSAYDQIVPPIYSRRILVYSVEEDHDFAETTRVLRVGFQPLIKQNQS